MKYLCLVYSDEEKLHSLPESPKDDECRAYAEALQHTGQLITGEALESVQTATTVRVRNGRLSVTDGPFAETHEQLGGYFMVDCKDLDEALRWAAKIPTAKFGSIEVRPLWTGAQ